MPETIELDGTSYEVLHRFTEDRVLIRSDMGAAVIIDRGPDGAWTTNSAPASADEEIFVEKFMPSPEATEVDVVKDP